MSLVDYSDLEKEISDAPAPKMLPRGSEVRARIISVREGDSENNNGCHWFMPYFDVPDDPMVIEFNTFFWDLADKVAEKVSEKQAARNLHSFREFAEAFDIDYSRPFSWMDDLPGKEGWVILGVGKDMNGEACNTVSKFVTRK